MPLCGVTGGSASAVIKTSGGDGRAKLGDVIVSGTLRSLSARTADLSGTLFSSDLLRAVQTAEHCAAATGLPVRTTAALREQGYGVLEGRPSRELWDVVDWTDPLWAAEGGESLAQLHGRVSALFAQLRAEPPAAVVALVTHGDTIRAAQAVAAGLGPDQLPAVTPHNGSVTRVDLP